MNMDFHVHGLLSKRKDFNEEFFMNEIYFSKVNGLNAIVICEHFNAKDFLVIYEFLEKKYSYDGDRYIVDGISVFPAMEVSIKNKGHVILCGDRENVINIYKSLSDFREKENFIELEELLDLAEVFDLLKIGAHPCRRGHKLCKHPHELLKRLDALDLNGKDIFKKGEAIARDEVINLSQELGLNIVTGSDSHTPIQLGGIYTNLNKECKTIKELKECIRNDDYSIKVNSSLNFKIFSSKILKRYLLKADTYDKNTKFKI